MIKLRKCNCCGDSKPSAEFSRNPRYRYAKHCRDCGVWLYLLRQVFPKTRDVEANREKCRLRAQDKNRKGAAVLWQSWMGMQA